eukprot:6486833-Amphidinium_carterae.1
MIAWPATSRPIKHIGQRLFCGSGEASVPRLLGFAVKRMEMVVCEGKSTPRKEDDGQTGKTNLDCASAELASAAITCKEDKGTDLFHSSSFAQPQSKRNKKLVVPPSTAQCSGLAKLSCSPPSFTLRSHIRKAPQLEVPLVAQLPKQERAMLLKSIVDEHCFDGASLAAHTCALACT